MQLPRDLSQDTTFLALVRARDGQLAYIGELRRIIAYQDNFRSRLERLLAAQLDRSSRDQSIKKIVTELSRLQTFKNDIESSKDLSAQISLAKKFDDDFPLNTSSFRPSGPPRFNDPRNISLNFETDPLGFMRRERANMNELFQNVSIDNRQFLSEYEKLFAAIEKKLDDSSVKAPLLDALPNGFDELAGAESINKMTKDQILSGITRYQDALQQTRDTISASPPPAESFEAVRVSLMVQADAIGKDLVTKSSEANTQTRELEKNISLAAKSLYGNKVGADSFNYLLIVFALVFIVIMIMPKFYPEAIAGNILKSEFLLQFSTVFVLVAAIIILAIGDFIAKDQLPVLLAGISGYVLGQLGSNTMGSNTRPA